MADLALSYASIGAAAMIAELDRVASHAEAMAASVTAAAADISGPNGIPAIPKAVDKLPAAAGSIDAFNDELKKLREQFNATGSAIERAHIGPQIAALEQQVASAEQSIPKATKSMGTSIKEFASEYAAAFGAAAVATVVAFGKESVAAFMEFETGLKSLESITGATADQMEFLGERAKTLGLEVEGGATATLKAFELIGSARPELLENEKALAGLTEQAITFSQAAGLDLPTAATALTDALNQFGEPASAAAKYMDVLAAGANYGAATIPQATEALLRFGTGADAFNVSIEESIAGVQLFSLHGLKGAEAGTAMRNILLKMQGVKGLGKEALDGLERAGVNLGVVTDQSIPLIARLQEMGKVFKDETAPIKVFGAENEIAAQALFGNLAQFDDLEQKMHAVGLAEKQAAINTATLAQSFLEIRNKIGVVMIELGERIAPIVREITDGFNPAWEVAKEALLAIYTPVVQMIGVLGEIAESLGIAGGEGNAFVSIVKVLSTAMRVALFPFQAITTVIGVLVDGVKLGIDTLKSARDSVRSFTDRIPLATEALDSMIYTISRMLMPLLLVKDAWDGLFGESDETTAALTDAERRNARFRQELSLGAAQIGATERELRSFVETQDMAAYSALSIADAIKKAKDEFLKWRDAIALVKVEAPDFTKKIKSLGEELEKVAAAGSIDALNEKLKKLQAQFTATGSELERIRLGQKIRAVQFELMQFNNEVDRIKPVSLSDAMKIDTDAAQGVQDFAKELVEAHKAMTDVSQMGQRADDFAGTFEQIQSSIEAIDLGEAVGKFELFSAVVSETFRDLKDGIKSAMIDIGADLAIGIGEAIAMGESVSQVFKNAVRNILIEVPKMAGMALLNAAAFPGNAPIALPLAAIGLGLLGLSGIVSGLYKASDAKKLAAENAAPSTASTTSAMPTPNRSGLEAYNGSDSQQPVAIYFDGPEGEKFTAWMSKRQIRQQGRRG